MSILLLTWFLQLGPGHTAVFSSTEYPAVFLPLWSEWHFQNGRWVAAVFGDSDDDLGITLYCWDKGKPIERLASTTAREGVYLVRNATLSPSGRQFVFQGYGNPAAFEYDLDQREKGFRRRFIISKSDDLLFWDDHTIIAAAKFPSIAFQVDGSDSLPALLDSLMDQIPDGIDHPIESRYYKNRMHLCRLGQQIALGFGIHPEVLVWNGVRRHVFSVGFAGYVEPIRDFPRDSRRYKQWFSQFHHLLQLTWFEGDLYGLYRKGYEEYGVWVRFEGNGSRVVWDNDRETTRIFTMQQDEMILGQQGEDQNGDVTWRLWRSSTLPTASVRKP